MGKNDGRFLCRETDYHEDGSRAITDTYVTDDGELQYHIYNVSADSSEHTHQITDEDGNHVYARNNDPKHKWYELDRMLLTRWIKSLSYDNINKLLQYLPIDELNYIKSYIQTENEVQQNDSLVYTKKKL